MLKRQREEIEKATDGGKERKTKAEKDEGAGLEKGEKMLRGKAQECLGGG